MNWAMKQAMYGNTSSGHILQIRAAGQQLLKNNEQEVGLESALVDLVNHQVGDSLQRPVALQSSQQDTLFTS